MTQQLGQDLKRLINTFVSQRKDPETCVDKIVELFEETQREDSEPKIETRRPSWNIFDGPRHRASSNNLGQRSRSSTYSESGFVNNTNTVLYDNRDID